MRLSEQIKDLGFHGNFPTREDYLFESDRDKAKEIKNTKATDLETEKSSTPSSDSSENSSE